MPQPHIVIFAASGTLDASQSQHWEEEGFAVDLVEVSDYSQLANAVEALQRKGTKHGIIGTGSLFQCLEA